MDSLQVPNSSDTQPQAEPRKKRAPTRPTLTIPPPQMYAASPYSANLTVPMTGVSMPMSGSPGNQVPFMYTRKASQFVFQHIDGLKDFTKSGLGVGEKFSYFCYNKIKAWSKKWFTHMFLTIVLVFYTVGGAWLFITIEGKYETREEIVERDLRYELIREMRNMSIKLPNKTSDAEWEGWASDRLLQFQQKIVEAHKIREILDINPDYKVWNFWNAIMFCGTIYTTIGYGHMYPTTVTGRALTIVYAIIGIPLFLIALTDFGKLFTRCIKFFWSFIRRLYYTGSCRKVRKTAHVQEIFKGAQLMYEIATFRRPSQFNLDPESGQLPAHTPVNPEVGNDTPTTPAISNFEIDDDFNLPISVAIFILVLYIFLGAVFYSLCENWDFFTSFYFVFISMSTIGFGDKVPARVETTIVSITYLVFGLALMSMCINVVQVKLSDTFQHASLKIGATIGLQVAEDDGSITTVPPVPVEMPEVHDGSKDVEDDGQRNVKESEEVNGGVKGDDEVVKEEDGKKDV